MINTSKLTHHFILFLVLCVTLLWFSASFARGGYLVYNKPATTTDQYTDEMHFLVKPVSIPLTNTSGMYTPLNVYQFNVSVRIIGNNGQPSSLEATRVQFFGVRDSVSGKAGTALQSMIGYTPNRNYTITKIVLDGVTFTDNGKEPVIHNKDHLTCHFIHQSAEGGSVSCASKGGMASTINIMGKKPNPNYLYDLVVKIDRSKNALAFFINVINSQTHNVINTADLGTYYFKNKLIGISTGSGMDVENPVAGGSCLLNHLGYQFQTGMYLIGSDGQQHYSNPTIMSNIGAWTCPPYSFSYVTAPNQINPANKVIDFANAAYTKYVTKIKSTGSAGLMIKYVSSNGMAENPISIPSGGITLQFNGSGNLQSPSGPAIAAEIISASSPNHVIAMIANAKQPILNQAVAEAAMLLINPTNEQEYAIRSYQVTPSQTILNSPKEINNAMISSQVLLDNNVATTTISISFNK